MKNDNILEVNNLSVSINEKIILNNLSFSVKNGEIFTIIGPNGAGKTLLFRVLLGLFPFQGTIMWQNKIKIGYIPQRFLIEGLIPLTVKEFFLLKSNSFWFPSKNFLSHFNHELDLVGLSSQILNKQIREISGGEFQRVSIAWTMLNHPDVLLLDEPTSEIDIGFEKKIYSLIHHIQKERGTTIILISHDLNIVYHYANYTLYLNKEFARYGKPKEVLTSKEITKLYNKNQFHC